MSLDEAVVVIPKVIVDKVRSLGVDLESYIVERLLHELELDPNDLEGLRRGYHILRD